MSNHSSNNSAALSTIAASRRSTIGTDANSHSNLTVETTTQRDLAINAWQELELRLQSSDIMSSTVWTETWLQHYRDLIAHRFVIARIDDRVVGICLLCEGVQQFEGPFSIRTLHVGTSGEPQADQVCVEYNRLLVEPGLQQQFLERILEIAVSDARWDQFHLDGFTQDDVSPLLLNEPTFSVSTETSHFFDLKLTREQSLDVISQLRGSTRKQIRRNKKAYDKIETEWAQDIDHAISIFSDLLQLHQARWNGIGKPGVFSSVRFTQFHIDLIKKLIPLKRAALFRVTNDGDVVGCVYMLIDANRALCYSTGTAPYEGRLSPGVHCCYLCIEECLHQGLDAFDFMCGEMYYKKSLSTNSANLVWATYRRRRLKFALVKTIRSFKRFMNSMRRAEDSLE